MKIAFFEVEEGEEAEIKNSFKGHSLDFFKEPLGKDNIKKARSCDIISIFVYSKIDKKILSGMPKLKLISTRSVGYDHIDLKECRKKRIIVCNVPSYGENTVAEHAFALILSLSRNVHKAYLRGLSQNYDLRGLKGWDLRDKIIGVVGAGHIGMNVIKIAKGFGMKVLAYDLKKDNIIAKGIGFDYVNIESLLRDSDIISLHLPYNENTKHIINSASIKKMKKGVIIINTARGGLIDTKALLNAIEKKQIGGAGLDVIEDEDIIKEDKEAMTKNHEKIKRAIEEYRLLKNENVVFTPHMAFYSNEAIKRIHEVTIQNISGFLEKKIQNSVL